MRYREIGPENTEEEIAELVATCQGKHAVHYGEIWKCQMCLKNFCWAEGTDDHIELCDACWVKFTNRVEAITKAMDESDEGILVPYGGGSYCVTINRSSKVTLACYFVAGMSLPPFDSDMFRSIKEAAEFVAQLSGVDVDGIERLDSEEE